MRKTLMVFLLLLSVSGGPTLAAPSADLWPRWSAHDAQNQERLDHRGWAELLRSYLYVDSDGVNRFAYGKVTEADQEKLENYLKLMSQVKISEYNRDVQLAYWINLYNALTIREILRAYPVDSIRDISPHLFSFGPWDRNQIVIEGEVLSLNDIEHRILRPIWQDPRIHYAVNCASIGCPNLQERVFTASSTERMLDRAAREFVNHPRGAQIVDGKLRVSSIYVWFIEDFGDDDAGVIRHLQQYANGELANSLREVEEIDNHDYDWRLNSLGGTENAKRKRGRRGS